MFAMPAFILFECVALSVTCMRNVQLHCAFSRVFNVNFIMQYPILYLQIGVLLFARQNFLSKSLTLYAYYISNFGKEELHWVTSILLFFRVFTFIVQSSLYVH